MKRIRKKSTLGILLFASIAVIPLTVCAQSASYPVEQGDWIRLQTFSHSTVNIEGRVAGITSEHVSVLGMGGAQRWKLPWREITELQVRREKSNTGTGALIGLGAGLALGGVIGAATYKECDDVGFMACFMVPEDRGQAFVWGAAVGLLPGLLLGALFGATTKTADWQSVEIGLSGQPLVSAQGGSSISHTPTLRLKIPLGK